MGAVEFFCDRCGHKFHTVSEWLGEVIRCPECGHMVGVPKQKSVPVAVTTPARPDERTTAHAAAPAPTETAAAQGPPCVHHGEVAATWQCETCGVLFCDRCIKTQVLQRTRLEICPLCGGKCEAIELAPVPQPGAWRAFVDEIPKAFGYPFRGIGQVILFTGMIAFLIANLVPIIGFVVAVIMLGYVAAYQISVIRESAGGENDPPTWPDFTNAVDDLIVPFLHVSGRA